MNTIRRAALLKLASSAYEMKLGVMRGMVTQDANGRLQIGGQDLGDWLQQHLNEEVVIVMGSLQDDRPVQTRTCRTCGRDYTDIECSHCRTSRIRLRGHG